MNPLAQQALARARMPARQPVATKPAKSATKAPVYATSPPIYASPTSVDAPKAPVTPAYTGPINHYQVMQGRQHAIDIAESAGTQLSTAHGIKEVIARLTRSTANKPASFAQGIREIIEVLQKALP